MPPDGTRLIPHKPRFVLEAPCLDQDLCLEDLRRGHPKEQHGIALDVLRHGQGRDVVRRERGVVRFGGGTDARVLVASWRISVDHAEAPGRERPRRIRVGPAFEPDP